MRPTDIVRTAAVGLRQNLFRSLLAALGIVIGIGSVIVMLSLGKGAEGLILGQVSSFGPNTIFIQPGGGGSGPPRPGALTTIKYRDWQTIRRRTDVLSAIAPVSLLEVSVTFGSAKKTVSLNATAPDIAAVNNLRMAEGGFFTDDDLNAARSVAVIGTQIAKDLFDGQNPVGERIRLNRKSFTVVGVVAPQGTQFFQNLDERVYIPITAMRKELSAPDYVNFIAGVAAIPVPAAQEELRLEMRDLHGINNPTGDTAKDDFRVGSSVEAAAVFGSIATVLTLFLTSIASVSLLVGGIGIMNIMLVSVTERTREIGLRMAVGASRRDVLGQFLTEAILLTVGGGIMGVVGGAVFSFLASLVIERFQSGWMFAVPLDAIVLAVGTAVVAGVAFGFYPAFRASRLDPIVALRFE